MLINIVCFRRFQAWIWFNVSYTRMRDNFLYIFCAKEIPFGKFRLKGTHLTRWLVMMPWMCALENFLYDINSMQYIIFAELKFVSRLVDSVAAIKSAFFSSACNHLRKGRLPRSMSTSHNVFRCCFNEICRVPRYLLSEYPEHCH